MSRSVARWLATGLVLCLALGVVISAPAQAKTYALVIGIDEYDHITSLRGAVNDATDVADALRSLPDTEVVALFDHEATRAAVLSTWRGIAAKALPTDQIIVTFAGHGSHEPAAYPETERDDGRDEILLMSGFAADGAGAAERIRDDEIAELIALTPEITVIVILDACHSGTATRASTHDLGYRFHDLDKITNDPLPPPPPPAPEAMDPKSAQNSIVFSAVSDAEKAPEVPIEGKVRGALSYAFASGARGAADHDGDGVVSKGELELHIRQFVKQATAGRQKPQVWPPGARKRAVMSLTEPQLVETTGPFATPFAQLPPVTIRSEGTVDAGALFDRLHGVRVITPDQDDLGTVIVSLQHRELRSVQGDQLRELLGRSDDSFVRQIQETVDKIRGARAVQKDQIDATLDVWFPLGDEVYLNNDPIVLAVDGRQKDYVSIFNVPSDGTIEWIYPVLPKYFPDAGFEDPPSISPRDFLEFEVAVQPPFGGDHVFVIETPGPHDTVHAVLNKHNLATDFPAFWDDMHRALAGQEYDIAVHSYYSRRN